ncbi:MAG TPA: protease SohB [Gammaproteobacteria bacterium]|nr:protease SohB [Gammaproteobacteria bacterium]
MAEFFIQYGLFAAKIVTFVAVAVVGIGFIISMAASKAGRSRESLEIENINDKLDDYKSTIEAAVLTKDEYKAIVKKQKKEDKKELKERKARLKLGEEDPYKPRLFIVKFEGDMHASEVENLREAVTTILSIAKEMDEVLVLVESPGGIVHSYGLAASQLVRIKQKNIKLTISVDLIAASGGYMMACVADRIIAAPFAVLGSVGVLAEIPNFYGLLKKHDIDIEHHTAGEYKTTLTMLAKNTEKGREKFQEELQDIHTLFKQFVSTNRPQLDMSKIATGEAWYGEKALELGLVDAIQTSDDYIVEKAANSDVYEVSIQVHETLKHKLSNLLYKSASTAFERAWYRLSHKFNFIT